MSDSRKAFEAWVREQGHDSPHDFPEDVDSLLACMWDAAQWSRSQALEEAAKWADGCTANTTLLNDDYEGSLVDRGYVAGRKAVAKKLRALKEQGK